MADLLASFKADLASLLDRDVEELSLNLSTLQLSNLQSENIDDTIDLIEKSLGLSERKQKRQAQECLSKHIEKSNVMKWIEEEFPGRSSVIGEWSIAMAIVNATLDRDTKIKKLLINFPRLLQSSPASAVKINDGNRSIMQMGYGVPYRGKNRSIENTYNIIKGYVSDWSPLHYFAPYTAIVGPSLSGKTRLLHELGNKVHSIYICLRPSDSSGLPEKSRLADLIVKQPNKTETYYFCFLYALLKAFNTSMDQKFRDTREWFQYQASIQFYESVSTFLMSKFEETKRMSAEELENRLINEIRTQSLVVQTKVRGRNLVKLIISFDEGRELLLEHDQHDVNLFRLIRRSLGVIPEKSFIFVLITDTTSKMSNFSPSFDNSARDYRRIRKLFPPIYQIQSFDVMLPDKAPTSTRELNSFSRILSYGVPFFRVYYDSAKSRGESEEQIKEFLINYTVSKLLCYMYPTSKPTAEMANDSSFQVFKWTIPRTLAVLGPIINVLICGNSELNSELTASHLAFCLYISEKRDRLESGYGSSQILAEAANHIFEEDTLSILQNLTTIIRHGFISKGDAGELGSKLILQLAMLETIRRYRKENNLEEEKHHRFCQPVRLSLFLKVLTGKDPLEKNAEGEFILPLGSINPKNRETLFNTGYIFWNHFVNIRYTPTISDLLNLLYRGAAAQCKEGQESFDELFTVYLDKTGNSSELWSIEDDVSAFDDDPNEYYPLSNDTALDGPEEIQQESEKILKEAYYDVHSFDARNVTFCGIQTKNRKKQINMNELAHLLTPSKAGLAVHRNPYLDLYFSLSSVTSYMKPFETATDECQASLSFVGLNSFKFLSQEIRDCLWNIVNARPDPIKYNRAGNSKAYVFRSLPLTYKCHASFLKPEPEKKIVTKSKQGTKNKRTVTQRKDTPEGSRKK